MNINRFNNAFLCLIDPRSGADSVAIKDIIDVEGYKTTAGSKFLSSYSDEVTADAECVEKLRKVGYRVFGKTNLSELAFGTTGINESTGTPVNPLGSHLIPGGSSSGNAVALASNFCDLAVGTDTGGSVRIPSACCGTTGLKTTFGRLSTKGVRPLAPSLDVVGPMARDIDGLTQGLCSLDPNFVAEGLPSATAYRLRVGDVDPRVDMAIDAALSSAGIYVEDCPVSEGEWEEAINAVNILIWTGAANSNIELRDYWEKFSNGGNLLKGLDMNFDADRMKWAENVHMSWKERFSSIVEQAAIVVSPTIECLPPTFGQIKGGGIRLARFTSPVSLAGLPALSMPVPANEELPSSIQLVGQANSEGVLLATAEHIERSLGIRENTYRRICGK